MPSEIVAHVVREFDWVQFCLALATIFVACVSIIFTVKSYNIQRTHNIKSVRPLFVVKYGSGNNFYIKLHNNGLGPGIINTMVITKSNQKYGSIREILLESNSKEIVDVLLEYSDKIANISLAPGEDLMLIIMCKEDYSSDKYDELRSIAIRELNNTEIKISYSDLYDNHIEPMIEAIIFKQEK
ncbi:hypothetical protein FACS1894127_0750 [Clostridia bacterium]|nr:hypothetical protein FACS1894127_0750 [Clostridia bacterium]